MLNNLTLHTSCHNALTKLISLCNQPYNPFRSFSFYYKKLKMMLRFLCIECNLLFVS